MAMRRMPESRMPGGDDLILNMSLKLGDATIMASDSPPDWYREPQGFSVSISPKSLAEVDRVYQALSQRREVDHDALGRNVLGRTLRDVHGQVRYALDDQLRGIQGDSMKSMEDKSVSRQVFINLPVADLPKSMAFFQALGFSYNTQFSDDNGACIVISDTILVMLLVHARFRDFTSKSICDTSKTVEVLLTLSCDSREEVDYLVAKAVAAGGSTYDKPEDHGFMYTHNFVDPDGHGWRLAHMSARPEKK